MGQFTPSAEYQQQPPPPYDQGSVLQDLVLTAAAVKLLGLFSLFRIIKSLQWLLIMWLYPPVFTVLGIRTENSLK